MRLSVLFAVALAAAQAQSQPVRSGVYRWADLTPRREGGRVVRPVLTGSTTDLADLEIHATTLPSPRVRDTVTAANDAEHVVIVKDGRLRATLRGATTEVGPGSVVVRLPGEPLGLASAGDSVTYYVLAYHAKAPVQMARGTTNGPPAISDWTTVKFEPSQTGGRRQPFDRPTAMFGRFEMHVSTLNEGLTNHAVHTHRTEEFVLMRQGDVRMTIGDTKQSATAGDLIFLASNVPHALDNVGRGAAEYFAFQGY